MKLDQFNQAFAITANPGAESHPVFPASTEQDVRDLISLYGGRTFEHGLYRILRADQLAEAREAMELVFPEFRGRIEPFGFDWLGRHFALDRGRVANGSAQVLMLEVGAGEAMQIPASVADFHNVELVEYADDALSVPFWQRWHEGHPLDLAHSECVGYKVPLFLGGPDELPNLELIDLSVYVEICGQLRHKTRSLAPGQTIAGVSIGG